jgi:hypothetical protein
MSSVPKFSPYSEGLTTWKSHEGRKQDRVRNLSHQSWGSLHKDTGIWSGSGKIHRNWPAERKKGMRGRMRNSNNTMEWWGRKCKKFWRSQKDGWGYNVKGHLWIKEFKFYPFSLWFSNFRVCTYTLPQTLPKVQWTRNACKLNSFLTKKLHTQCTEDSVHTGIQVPFSHTHSDPWVWQVH